MEQTLSPEARDESTAFSATGKELSLIGIKSVILTFSKGRYNENLEGLLFPLYEVALKQPASEWAKRALEGHNLISIKYLDRKPSPFDYKQIVSIEAVADDNGKFAECAKQVVKESALALSKHFGIPVKVAPTKYSHVQESFTVS